MDRGAEMAIFNTDADVQKGDMGGGSVPGEVDGILTVDLFREVSEGVGSMGPPQTTSAVSLKLHTNLCPPITTQPRSQYPLTLTFHPRLGGT